MMLRIEAGLPLVDVEWHNSRTAFTDHERVTPTELGMGWMLRGVADGRPRVRRRSARSGASWPRGPRGGPASASSSTGWPGTRCTATPGCCRPRTSTRCPTSRCSTTGRRPPAGSPGRLRHQLHVLPRAAAPHRPRPGAPRPGGPRARRCTWSWRSTTPTPRCSPARRGCPCSTPRGRRPSHDATSTYDAIVVGGGHNGLVNAGYLAKAGLRTLVLEQRDLVGGAAITEELLPGLLVHHVLLRAEPAAAGDHPGARPGRSTASCR